MSRSQAGKPIADHHPAMALLTEARFAAHAPEEVARGKDVVFLALEHGDSSKIMGALIDSGSRWSVFGGYLLGAALMLAAALIAARWSVAAERK